MAAPERSSPTNKDVSLLQQLYKSGQLVLAPDFQRQGVWPRPAKAYLVDTILADRPIPLLFFSKSVNPQTGRPSWAVVDGQQRIRAILDFLSDRFRLPATDLISPSWRGKKYSELSNAHREQILNYDLSVVELKNYSDADIRDIFVRMNKYVVKLNASELRHAYDDGAFKRYVERIGAWSWWTDNRVFTPNQVQRMRPVEYCAELTILLVEGPQDKKDSIDLYYQQYSDEFEYEGEVSERLVSYLDWIADTLPDIASSRWRKPVDLYGLIGAIDVLSEGGELLGSIDKTRARIGLNDLSRNLRLKRPPAQAARYSVAASRQTDNIQPRTTRISVLAAAIGGGS